MSHRRSIYIPLEQHELHISEWGDPAAPPVIMWHGLARNGRDFDWAARVLSKEYRVICPDTIGRGLSTWSDSPLTEYVIPVYCGHVLAMMAALNIETCRWVGTSMGGLIGMCLAGSPFAAHRISHLVMNDVGPELNQAAIDRIKTYAGKPPQFRTMTQFEAYLREVYAPFGLTLPDEWRHMADISARRLPDGTITSHLDPGVMDAFAHFAAEVQLWDIYDALRCKTMVLRGETSDLLDADVAQQMTQRGPLAQLHTIPGCGHAPALNTQSQIALLHDFLAS